MKQKKRVLSSLLALSLTGTCQATLIDRGGGLIYDDVLDITWLQDANYAFTSGYATTHNGRMDWDTANTWANNLSYGGYDDWRLTSMTDIGNDGCNIANSGTDCGYNVDTDFSEMAYMFHNNLGLKSLLDASGASQSASGIFGNGTYNGVDQSTFGEKDFALMQNVQSFVYWSGVEYAPNLNSAWGFYTGDGHQDNSTKVSEFNAWAVRTGDVTAPVPIPMPFWLMGSGLLGLVGWKRKQ